MRRRGLAFLGMVTPAGEPRIRQPRKELRDDPQHRRPGDRPPAGTSRDSHDRRHPRRRESAAVRRPVAQPPDPPRPGPARAGGRLHRPGHGPRHRQAGSCFATSGPGATNVLTAVADAKLDSIPLVCITGQVPRAMIGTDAFQEVDTYGLSIPITKHNFLVRSAGELLEVVPEAFRIAASGRPGPVWIDVPKDVQNEAVEFDAWPEPGRPDPPSASRRSRRSTGRGDDQRRAAAGAVPGRRRDRSARRGGLATALAEKASIPRHHDADGPGRVPSDHPLSLGCWACTRARYTNLALEECDLLIAAGVRFDDRATGKVAQFCPHAEIIHIDIDPSELDKIKTAARGHRGRRGPGAAVAVAAECRNARHRTDWLAHRAAQAAAPLADSRQRMIRGTPYGLILQTAAWRGDDADRHHRRGPASDVDGAGVSVPPPASVAHLRRAGHDGFRPAGGHRRGAGLPGPDGGLLQRRRQPADEHPGIGDRRRGGRECQDRAC